MHAEINRFELGTSESQTLSKISSDNSAVNIIPSSLTDQLQLESISNKAEAFLKECTSNELFTVWEVNLGFYCKKTADKTTKKQQIKHYITLKIIHF